MDFNEVKTYGKKKPPTPFYVHMGSSMMDVKVCKKKLWRPKAMSNLVLDVWVLRLNAQDRQFDQGTTAAPL